MARYPSGVRPLALWGHEVRRAGRATLLGPPSAFALGAVVFVADPLSDDVMTARILLGVLEMAVPLAVGVGCASLVGRDRALAISRCG